MALVALEGGRLASADAEGEVAIWNPAHLDRAVARWDSGHGRVWGILPLPAGRFATMSEDGALTIWDPARPGRPERTFETGHGPVFAAATLAGRPDRDRERRRRR